MQTKLVLSIFPLDLLAGCTIMHHLINQIEFKSLIDQRQR